MLAAQFLLTPVLALLAGLPAAAAPVETQDAPTQIVSATFLFNGTDGSLYNSTVGSPSGTRLGTVAHNFTLGRGFWGAGATFSGTLLRYPGHVILAPQNAPNEIFVPNGTRARWYNASGGLIFETPAGPRTIVLVSAADFDGDGFLDDGATTNDQRRAITYDETGTQLGSQQLGGTNGLNAIMPVDADGNGVFDQLIVGHQNTRVYLINSAVGQVWNFVTPTAGAVIHLAIADLDNDTLLENTIAGASDGFVFAINGTGNPPAELWRYNTNSSVAGVAGFDPTSAGYANGVLVGASDAVTALGWNGAVIWNFTANATVTAVAPADLDGDGLVDDAAFGDATGAVTYLNESGTVVGFLAAFSTAVVELKTVDLDADGLADDFAAANATEVVGLDSAAAVQWRMSTGASVNAMVAADFDGNGTVGDTVVATASTLYAFDRTGARRWSSFQGTNITSVAFARNPSAAPSGYYASPELDAEIDSSWTNLTWNGTVNSAAETLNASLRFGSGTPGNISWTSWSSAVNASPFDLRSNTSRFIQVRFDLASTDGRNTAVLSSFRLNYTTPASSGAVDAQPFAPPSLPLWLDTSASFNATNGTVRFYYSADNGSSWHLFTPGDSIDGANQTAPSLRFRVELLSLTGSPEVVSLTVRYRQPSLVPTITSPSANSSITGVFNVTAATAPSIVAVSLAYGSLSDNVSVPLGGATQVSPGVWNFSWDTRALNLTAAALKATARDSRGFDFSATVQPFEIDNAPPVVAVTAPLPNENFTGVYRLQAVASTDAVSLDFTFFNGSFQPIGSAAEVAAGLWELDWDTRTLGSPTLENIDVFARAVDEVGLSAQDDSFPVTVDNEAPWVAVLSPSNASNITGAVDVAFRAAPDTLSLNLSVVTVNGTIFLAAASLTSKSATETRWSARFDSSFVRLEEGAVLRGRAVDRVGLEGTGEQGGYTIANLVPIPSWVAPTSGSHVRGAVPLEAIAPGGTASVRFSYTVGSGTLRTIAQASLNSSSGYWEFSWNTLSPKLDLANVTLVVEATDASGFTGNATVGPIEIDNTPPVVQFAAPRVDEVRISGNYTVLVLADADVVSVTLSYRNGSSGQTTAVGPMFFNSSILRFQLDWDLNPVFVGGADLIATASDEVGHVVSATISDIVLGIRPGDNPPTIVRVPSEIVLDEDFGSYRFDLEGLIVDDDLSNVTVYLDGVNTSLIRVLNNGSKNPDTIYFVSMMDAHSVVQSQLRLRVVDASGQATSREFGLFVRAVNDPPSWVSPPPRIFVRYDYEYVFDFAQYVHDVEYEREGAALTLSASDPRITADSRNPLVQHFLFPQALVDQSVVVVFSLSDRDPSLEPVTATITVEITSDWVPELRDPTNTTLPTIELFEDSPRYDVYNLHDFFFDRDNDSIFYYTGFTHVSIQIAADGNVSVTSLPLDWYGTDTVYFGARDGKGAFAEARAKIVVSPVNDAPEWNVYEDHEILFFRVRFNTTFVFDLSPYVADVDNASSDLRVVNTDPFVQTAFGLPLTIILNYPEWLNGSSRTLTLQISDGLELSPMLNLTVFISDNFPPAPVKPLPQEIVLREGEIRLNILNFNDYFHDRDNEVLLWWSRPLFVNVTISPDGWLSVAALGEWNGTDILIVRAFDREEFITAAYSEGVIYLTVLPVDDPPRFERFIPDLTVEYGVVSPLRIVDYVTDPDTPIEGLNFSARTQYQGAFLTVINGVLHIIYAKYEGAPAFDSLTVCASDGNSTVCRRIAVKLVTPVEQGFDFLRFFVFIAAVGAASVVIARHFFEFKVKRPPTVEELYLVYEDGIMIRHLTKKVRKYADEDVVTSMLSAIQSFARDSFEDTENWTLREITFGGRKILIERAAKFQIFVIFDGDSTDDMKKAVRESAVAVQAEYGQYLKDWDGDPSHFEGVDKHFSKLLEMEAAYIPEEVSADELVRPTLIPGGVYISESGGFAPLIKAYGEALKGAHAIRVRPGDEAGASVEGLETEETAVFEVRPPEGVPGEEATGETALEVTVRAIADEVERIKSLRPAKAPVVLFEGFETIVDQYGFVFSKKFADALKKLVGQESLYLFIAVDPEALSEAQLEGLERGGFVLRGA